MSLPPRVLIFAEDSNDAEALKELVKAVIPAALIKVLRDPPVLGRDTALTKRIKMSATIAAFAHDAANDGRRVIVVAHRDCDSIEPAHIEEARALKATLAAAGVANPVPATPAWEMETWWMLFPSALARTRGCWKKVKYTGQVGMIFNAKERLQSDLHSGSNRCPRYRESDSIAIARHVRELGLLNAARTRCSSLAAFCDALESAAA